jgi:hypothetical protein
MAAANYGFRLPEPLKLSSSSAAGNWKRFHEQWLNFEVAMDLRDAAEEKRVAIFLTCLGSEA